MTDSLPAFATIPSPDHEAQTTSFGPSAFRALGSDEGAAARRDLLAALEREAYQLRTRLRTKGLGDMESAYLRDLEHEIEQHELALEQGQRSGILERVEALAARVLNEVDRR